MTNTMNYNATVIGGIEKKMYDTIDTSLNGLNLDLCEY